MRPFETRVESLPKAARPPTAASYLSSICATSGATSAGLATAPASSTSTPAADSDGLASAPSPVSSMRATTVMCAVSGDASVSSAD